MLLSDPPIRSDIPAPLLAFGDESMRRVDSTTMCYFMAAAILPAPQCEDVRDALRPLARKKLQRVHWRDEEESAKVLIVKTIAAMHVESLVVVGAMVDHQNQERARAQVLKALLYELDRREVAHLMLESRHAERDRHDLRSIGHFRDARLVSRRLVVSHGEPLQEPLLWLADAVAGGWRSPRRPQRGLQRVGRARCAHRPWGCLTPDMRQVGRLNCLRRSRPGYPVP
ncbi:hypothetical protein [Intrasporangium mesophilum]